MSHKTGFITILALSQDWLYHNTGFITRLALSQYLLFHKTGFITRLALSQDWLYHNTGFITILALSQDWLYHKTGFITILALSQYLLYHNTGFITRLALSQDWLYHKTVSICESIFADSVEDYLSGITLSRVAELSKISLLTLRMVLCAAAGPSSGEFGVDIFIPGSRADCGRVSRLPVSKHRGIL